MCLACVASHSMMHRDQRRAVAASPRLLISGRAGLPCYSHLQGNQYLVPKTDCAPFGQGRTSKRSRVDRACGYRRRVGVNSRYPHPHRVPTFEQPQEIDHYYCRRATAPKSPSLIIAAARHSQTALSTQHSADSPPPSAITAPDWPIFPSTLPISLCQIRVQQHCPAERPE
ncbi:hypothetical protein K402DRAFT_238359 [Aulographum hederae CBS 113979]|uniref:Uncharacterized protein n=1 Tax=Aulographum hederae CBS 113979 TaxID=1176131 RepID=A0A6G1GKJ8_9PEZI|nr:hypothetical protein K402DRAFT_238359 [Aulographum hederae CBS 113979]